MKIKDILAKGQPTLSFEVFPPKEESNFASVVLKVGGRLILPLCLVGLY